MGTFVLPGDDIGHQSLAQVKNPAKGLSLGPGTSQTRGESPLASNAGTLCVDGRSKNRVWIENNGQGRYVPALGDYVIATVLRMAAEAYQCQVAPHAPIATLGQLAFEGVTRKTRPNLQTGSLVYARVSKADRDMEVELECVDTTTGRSEGLGELKGGMVFDVSTGMARRMLAPRPREGERVLLPDSLGEKGVRFNAAVGRNGRIWVDAHSVTATATVGKALQDVDTRGLSEAEQDKLAKAVARQLVK